MLMSDLLKNCLSEHQTWWSLPAEFYVTDQAFDLDMQMIKDQWFMVGSVADLRRTGDFMVVDIGQESIILIRNHDGEIKGFFNVCCHRGSQVLLDKTGSCANLVCHYHQWTYDLNGKLIYAGSMGDDFNLEDFQLQPVTVLNLSGLLFICMSNNPPPFAAEQQMIHDYISPYRLDELKVAAVDDVYHDVNWKLIIENNRECYHCESNHPELCMIADANGFGFGEQDLTNEDKLQYHQYHQKKIDEWEQLGLYHELQDYPDGSWVRLCRYALINNSVSHTLDGQPACSKFLAPFEYSESSSLSFWTYPNTWNHFNNDHVVNIVVLPISAQRALVRTKWLVHEDAVEGEDYDLDRLTTVWKNTNQQDGRLFESVMKGLRSSGYRSGPICPEENFLVHFNEWYKQKISRY